MRMALVVKVAMQLPARERMVLTTIWVLVQAVLVDVAKLKEGQNIHRKRVPMIESKLE